MANNDTVREFYTEQIKEEFRTYCHDDYKDYLDGRQLRSPEWESFKEKAIQELYNSGHIEPFCESYSHLVFFLGMCIPQSEWFIDWDEPQKVYQLGLYLLAEEVIMGLDRDGYIPEESDDEDEDDDEDEEYEEESDEDSNIVFNCSGCDRAIVRDSIAHDNCITKDGKKWYCLDCFDLCEYESDQDEIQL